MRTPLGTQIQDLERIIIENLKETELVEHPHFYHGRLKDPNEPLTLCYKVVDIFTTEVDSYDPLVDAIPFEKFLQTGLPGIPVIETRYDESTSVHTLRIGLYHATKVDAQEFKYKVLLKLNEAVTRYLEDAGKRPSSRQENYKRHIERHNEAFKQPEENKTKIKHHKS